MEWPPSPTWRLFLDPARSKRDGRVAELVGGRKARSRHRRELEPTGVAESQARPRAPQRTKRQSAVPFDSLNLVQRSHHSTLRLPLAASRSTSPSTGGFTGTTSCRCWSTTPWWPASTSRLIDRPDASGERLIPGEGCGSGVHPRCRCRRASSSQPLARARRCGPSPPEGNLARGLRKAMARQATASERGVGGDTYSADTG